jgi:chromosome partitioning protein
LRHEFALQPQVPVQSGGDNAARHLVIDSSIANAAALFAAVPVVDAVILPVGPSQADVWSAQRFLEQIAGHAPRSVLAVLNRADTHLGVPESGEAEQALRQLEGIHGVLPRIAQRTVFRR